MEEQRVREVKNPGGRGPMRGPRPKVENPGRLMKRLLKKIPMAAMLYIWAVALSIPKLSAY